MLSAWQPEERQIGLKKYGPLDYRKHAGMLGAIEIRDRAPSLSGDGPSGDYVEPGEIILECRFRVSLG